jgi:hypothetical protein
MRRRGVLATRALRVSASTAIMIMHIMIMDIEEDLRLRDLGGIRSQRRSRRELLSGRAAEGSTRATAGGCPRREQ